MNTNNKKRRERYKGEEKNRIIGERTNKKSKRK